MKDEDDSSAKVVLTHRKTKREREMDFIIERWKAAHPEADGAPIEPHRISAWATSRGLWDRPPVTAEELLRKELSRFLKKQHIIDPKGRDVRKNHAILVNVVGPNGVVKRRSQWHTIYEAPPEHMLMSLQLRRRQAYADVRQVRMDWESYNDYNILGAELQQMSMNFDHDLEEAKLPTVYPSEPPKFDDDDDESGGKN